MIDTHCHLHDAEAFPDPATEVALAHEMGVDRIFVVGVNPPDWDKALAMADRFEEVYAILGWHPNYTADYDSAQLPVLEKALSHPKVLALGEIGLDYHWDYSPVLVQHKALSEQLELARRLGKPVVFHAREAYGDLLDILEKAPRHPYLFHCFAGDKMEAKRAMALDATFGVDGPITYKKAEDLRQVVSLLPRDRVVIETDSPYLTPVPHRGKPNRPAYVAHVAEALARLWDVAADEAARITTENAERFFRLKERPTKRPPSD